MYYAFDWDNNLLELPTTIIMFAKDKETFPSEVHLSTEDFSLYRKKIGNEDLKVKIGMDLDNYIIDSNGKDSINLKDYQLIKDDDLSYQNFRDNDGKDVFFQDSMKAIQNESFCRSWNHFLKVLSDKEKAKRTYIITARGHQPKTILNVLKEFQRKNLIKYVPPLENIFPVSYEGLPSHLQKDASCPSEAKLEVIKHILFNEKERVVFNFSDDDLGTINLLRKELKHLVKEKPHIEINLFYTGDNQFKKHKVKHSFILKLKYIFLKSNFSFLSLW